MRKGREIQAALVPVQRADDHAVERHAACLARLGEGPIELLFLGDSITRRLSDMDDLWKKHFGHYAAANFGVGSDETGNLLWRIQNGELEGINPKLIVLLIGTNNAPRDRGGDITAAIERILHAIRRKCPASRILLLALLPRGASRGEEDWTPADAKTAKAISRANRTLSRRISRRRIRISNLCYADLGSLFLDARGRTRRDLMPDRLHPGRDGYEVLTAVMETLIDDLMH
jgi:lysophospholipase L1-like esterase